MVARHLVTTALEVTWPTEDVPVLFLGEWCRLYNRKLAWGNRDALVAPYHWDDRQKLHEDYLYLRPVYEKLLKAIAGQLNELHQTNHSLRYWRILIGPWLGYFIQILFDRWSMLTKVLQAHEVTTVRLIENFDAHLVPNDMAVFTSFFIRDDWNELIYSQIIEHMKVSIEKHMIKLDISTTNNDPINLSFHLKSILARVISRCLSFSSRDNEYFFMSSCLGLKEDFFLQFKLRQIPKLWRPIGVPACPFDPALRQWQLQCVKDEFVSLACALIPRNIPRAYVEGYKALDSLVEQLPWPKKPKGIFTSNAYSSDDVFKAWSARRVEDGAALIIGQHGGNYGMALWNFTEEHQTKIADRFLTWGWSEIKNHKIVPVGNLKALGRKIVSDPNGFALLVENAMPRQSYHMFSTPVAAGQWIEYFEDQCRFVEALPREIRGCIRVRLYSDDYDYSQKQRWKDRFSDVNLDDSRQSLQSIMKKTRLLISTYNATTYLESLSLNFPTIMFWNPRHWELRDSALPYFEKLKSVGIFHESPESAARHMNAVWYDLASWWTSSEVQAVRFQFCNRYAHIPEKPLALISSIFKDVVADEMALGSAQ